MASGASSLDSAGSNGTLSRSYTASSSDRSLSSASVRDYDGLKQQCEIAMHELQVLRIQNLDTVRRYDHTKKELDYFRGQHRAAMNQLEAAAQETSTLRTKYGDLATEKQRLDREVSSLQQELRIHTQVQEVRTNDGTPDALNQHYLNALRKYETIKEDYDSLRKRYDDLFASHTSAVSKLELAQEEIEGIKKQCEEMAQERNDAVRERNGLKHQCTAAIRQWDITIRERDDYREALAKVQQQHEEAVKEINQAMAVRMKASKDLKRLAEERNAAMQEYTLIMSERDTVHKEMEKMSDDLTQAYKKNITLETEHKDLLEEKKGLSIQIETLKREIASALYDRDKALKECNDLREKFGAKGESNREGFGSRLEYNAYRERDNSRKDPTEALTSPRDRKCQKERVDNLDQANQELDRLRKQMDKLQLELEEATQEAEVCKTRRDWAFSERDKIVLERESIRTLCDRLRKERDRAVSDLAEALRDSDDIKKQRNEASKELNTLREKMEADQDKENRIQQFASVGHNHSHDSAIDADLQEWETKILELDLSGLASDDDLGFELVGGREDPQFPNDSAIYVASITKGSIADGKLKISDCISRVNNLDCSNMSKRMVLETVRSGGRIANIVVRRRRLTGPCLYTTQLQLSPHEHHGLCIDTGLYICKITPGSLAAKEGNLAVGDRVLTINNKNVDGLKSAHEAMMALEQPSDVLTIMTLKSSSPCIEEPDYKPRKCHKMVNSSSQTENDRFYEDLRYLNQPIRQPPSAAPPTSNQPKGSDKVSQGPWSIIREKIDLVGGRRINKERISSPVSLPNDQPKPSRRSFEQQLQEDAIAQLDSVLESYNRNTVRKRNTPNATSGDNSGTSLRHKDGGTWPKSRHGPLTDIGTGTIVHPRRQKERTPLSMLISDSTTVPSSTHFYEPKKSFPSQQQTTPNRNPQHDRASSCSAAGYFAKPAEIDFSVKSGNIGNEVLEYYVKRKSTTSTLVASGVNSTVVGSVSPVTVGTGAIQSPLHTPPQFPYSYHAHTSGAELARFPSTQSGDSLTLDSRPYCFHPPYTTHTQHSHSPSADLHYHKNTSPGVVSVLPGNGVPNNGGNSGGTRSLLAAHSHPGYREEPPPLAYRHGYEGGTFPRKKENQRIRIPSNPSVTSKVSTSSIERASDHGGSPMPTFHVEVLSPGLKRNSLPDYCFHQKPTPGELRRVHIDKSVEPLGIQISCPDSGGVFVSTVSDYSLASQVGLQVGDQLLEVCGINMRSATYKLAASVLRQCGNSITMLVQYSPDKYHNLEDSATSTSGEEEEDENENHTRSGSPTPCNSPKTKRKSISRQSANIPTLVRQQKVGASTGVPGVVKNVMSGLSGGGGVSGGQEPLVPIVQTPKDVVDSATPTNNNNNNPNSNLTNPETGSNPIGTIGNGGKLNVNNPNSSSPSNNSSVSKTSAAEQPRYLIIQTRKRNNLGISLVGGNAVGIFVHCVQPDSLAFEAGLRTGDQILEYNGTDLRHATAEEAAYELAKPADEVTLLTQYNLERYNQVKDKPGDSFYIRTLFDRSGDLNDSLQLKFRKDNVLFVDNTMFNGVPGHWRAWLIDEDGHRQQCGIIPSKYKVEEELLLRRSLGDLEADARRGTTTARRSFFRRKKHQRSSSRDSKELASFSNMNLGWYSDSGALNEEAALCSYQRVERLDYPVFRPVLIVGPLAECVTEKLLQDFPDKFTRCVPEARRRSPTAMDNNSLVEFKNKGCYYEYTTVAAIKDICEKNSHCLLDINIANVERLHRHQIYPIVLLIKFKSTKQIREVKDSRFPHDKMSAKAAKELHEHALKFESDYRPYISAIIPAGVNIAYMCTQIKAAVDQEQNKTLWVPCAS